MTIACLQQDLVWENPEANRTTAEAELANVVADIIILPETFTTGFSDRIGSLTEEADGPTLHWAKQLALRHKALVVGSWVVSDKGRQYNRMHLVQPDGNYCCYNKAHTFRMSNEFSQIERGCEKLTIEWHGWRIRPAVCYDLRFPTWLRNNNLDYDLLIVSANWPAARRDVWDTLLKARAIENVTYVAGCNRVGNDGNNTPHNGGTAICDYCGRAVARADDNRQHVITAKLDLQALRNFRQRWPFHLDFD
ncbi:MAG: nitrilase family protein [Bacteroidales bacterium]|nr:nitrilase family protein [Bacteroidales bacterium]